MKKKHIPGGLRLSDIHNPKQDGPFGIILRLIYRFDKIIECRKCRCDNCF